MNHIFQMTESPTSSLDYQHEFEEFDKIAFQCPACDYYLDQSLFKTQTMDIEYSDDEVAVEPDAYKTELLAFGKYKGRTIGSMIATQKTRSYLKYLLKWDELKSVTRAHIQAAFAAYEGGKTRNRPPADAKPRKRKYEDWDPEDLSNDCKPKRDSSTEK
jgi:hypothetical protein